MSTDEEKEIALYNAIVAVLREPRPQWRARVLREAMEGIMRHMGWSEVRLPDQEDKP